jgi:hypothetical protein
MINLLSVAFILLSLFENRMSFHHSSHRRFVLSVLTARFLPKTVIIIGLLFSAMQVQSPYCCCLSRFSRSLSLSLSLSFSLSLSLSLSFFPSFFLAVFLF